MKDGTPELLKAAINKLQELDDQQADLWLGVENFAGCHLVCLESHEFSGFHWSSQILEGLILRVFKDSDITRLDFPDLLNRLHGSFSSASTNEIGLADSSPESPQALAAFHAAKLASSKSRALPSLSETAMAFYRRGLASAKSECLRYECSTGLGVELMNQREGELGEALACFTEARGLAERLGEDSIAIASYWAARACVLLGDISQAMETMLQAGQGTFVSALAVALHAEMITTSSTVEETVQRFTAARTRLTRFMPDLAQMLAADCGSPCCSSEFLLRYLNLDQFSAFFILEASKFPLQVLEPVQRAFFVFNLTRDLRSRLISTQQELELRMMDPKPHLEEAIHLFVTKHYDEGLEELIKCHRISLATRDLTCLSLVSDHFSSCIQLLQDIEQLSLPEVQSRLLPMFRRVMSSDDEDPEAWALFYTGLSGRNKSEDHCQLLKQALERSRAPPLLKLHACETLGGWGLGDLDFMEQAMVHADEIGEPELIIGSVYASYQIALLRQWRVDKAMRFSEKMLNIFRFSSSSWPENTRALALALSLQMRGMILQYLLEIKGGDELLDRASKIAKLLPTYPPLAKLHFHLSGREAELGWPYGLNFIANLSRLFSPRDQPLPLEHTFSPDDSSAASFEIHESINRLERMISGGELDAVENEATELLQRAGSSTVDARYFHQVRLLMLLARFSCSRHQKPGVLRIIQEFVDESLQLAQLHQAIATDYGLARWIHARHHIILSDLGEKLLALRKLEEVVRVECLEMDACFGKESWARIVRLDKLQCYFASLHSQLWDFNELQQALVWGERERTRDFLYTLELHSNHKDYMSEFIEFDKNFDKAWAELRSISGMVAENSVFIVISQRRFIPELQVLFIHPSVELTGKRYSSFTPVNELVSSIVSSSPRAWTLLGEYYEMLVKAFASELDRIQPARIIFIPSEEMSLVPFPALFSWESKEYLIQRYAIAIAPSLRFFKHCLKRWRELEELQLRECPPALLLGNPTSDLGYAEIEAEVVEQVLNQAGFQVSRIDGSDATCSVVLHQLPKSSWIHAACHAAVDKDHPQGALFLSDSPLTSDQIAGAPILQASGVVLSACSSGKGALRAEGVQGLPRFLHSRGVPAVVLSLWNVDDETTQLLMESMYKHLGAGSELVEALRFAAVELLEDECGPACDIKSWASFVVSGCPSEENSNESRGQTYS